MEKQLIYLLILRTFRVEMSSPGVISFAYTDFEILITSVAVKIHKSF